MSTLPQSSAAERNKGPILDGLRRLLPARGRVLEIGAGTGQHAVYFALAMPGLEWQVSDRRNELAGLSARIASEGAGRLAPPITLDVEEEGWPAGPFDAVYSSNTAHIMSWLQVQAMFRGVSGLLSPGACFCLYGPFRREGRFVSPSDEVFDEQLRARDPSMGLRDLKDLESLAAGNSLVLVDRLPMPANNLLLCFRKVG